MKRYEAYKDSGVDWIGEIPVGWECKRLGALLTVFSSKNHTDKPLLSITREKGVILRDLDNETENHNFIPDDLSGYKLIKEGQFGMNKMKAWQGSYGISDYDGIVSPAYFIFNVSEEIYPNFFHLAIRSKFYVAHFGSASDGVRIGQWDLSKPRMREIPFFIPPLPEQTAIAEFLDNKTAKIDQLIGIKQKDIELLKEHRQILIQQAVTKGLDATLPMKDSGVDWIGEIPEHWEVRKLKHIGMFINGYAFDSSEFKNEGVKVMKISNVQTMKTDWSDLSLIDLKYYNRLQKFRVLKGDLVFALTRPIISTGIKATIITEDEKILLNQRNSILRTKIEFDVKWLYFILFSEMFIQEFENNIDKTGQQPNISTNRIGNILVPFPKSDEILEIISYLENIEAKIAKAITLKEQEIEKLKEYKTVLIDNVVTGKVKVMDNV